MVAPPRTPLRIDRIRALNAPRPVTVELGERGRPSAITGDLGRTRTSADEHRRTVESIGEVWRVDDEWWRRPIRRRYMEVILEGGAHLTLYQDLVTGEWFAQGL